MIRTYRKDDKNELIELVRQNTPQFFHPSEEMEFEQYLENNIQDYFVYEVNSKIIGCGGVNYTPDKTSATLSWGIIHPNHHGQGIGKKLTQFRINHLKHSIKAEEIIVRTSQHVYKFYQKMGFEIEKTEKDFWAKGFDLYKMKFSTRQKFSL